MLSSWLFSKSKKKLIEELGGGGGTDYTAGDGIDISSGVISFDPSTMDAIPQSKVTDLDDDLADLAPKTSLSNPNILHNPWFTVNQRALTSLTSGGYMADRWIIGVSDNTTFTATRNSDGSITIDGTSVVFPQAVALIQKRTTTYINSLNGIKLTASVMFQDGTIKSNTFVFNSTETRTSILLADTYEIYTKPTVNEFFCIKPLPGVSITIKALKLEIGEISTLHLDPRPEYATELAKCQRYFQRLVNASTGTQNIGLAIAASATAARWICALPANMRADPTLSIGALALQAGGGSQVVSTGASIQQLRGNQAAIGINVASGLTAGTVYLVQHTTDTGNIDFSAEL